MNVYIYCDTDCNEVYSYIEHFVILLNEHGLTYELRTSGEFLLNAPKTKWKHSYLSPDTCFLKVIRIFKRPLMTSEELLYLIETTDSYKDDSFEFFEYIN